MPPLVSRSWRPSTLSSSSSSFWASPSSSPSPSAKAGSPRRKCAPVSQRPARLLRSTLSLFLLTASRLCRVSASRRFPVRSCRIIGRMGRRVGGVPALSGRVRSRRGDERMSPHKLSVLFSYLQAATRSRVSETRTWPATWSSTPSVRWGEGKDQGPQGREADRNEGKFRCIPQGST